jgi:hypothetical protein
MRCVDNIKVDRKETGCEYGVTSGWNWFKILSDGGCCSSVKTSGSATGISCMSRVLAPKKFDLSV